MRRIVETISHRLINRHCDRPCCRIHVEASMQCKGVVPHLGVTSLATPHMGLWLTTGTIHKSVQDVKVCLVHWLRKLELLHAVMLDRMNRLR